MAKKRITNTSKDEVHPEWVMGGNPRAIEAQEARGQQELAEASELPRKLTMGGDAKPKYKELGFEVSEKEDDELFYEVVMPKGYRLVPTDHSMWSELKDPNNKVVASVFYKAAFYDRKASISFKD